MDESAEVLARLERYAASVRVVARLERYAAAVRAGTVVAPRRRWGPGAVAARELVGVAAGALAIVVFERFDYVVALAMTATFVVAGFVGARRRVPLAPWWIIGVVLGGVVAALS